MEDGRFQPGAEHQVMIEGRERLSVTGVEEVESFDENAIVMNTVKGVLVIRGTGLHIEQLSLDGGAMKVEGFVDSLTYEEERSTRSGLLSRLFGG